MKAAKAWCVAGLLVVAGFSTASCGKDEADGGGGGSGMILGGSAGTAGAGGQVGRAGSGGSSGSSTFVPAGTLGQGCVNDSECSDTPGLTCIKSTDVVLGSGSPPRGVCSTSCSLQNDTCDSFGAGALCVPFEAGNTGYCMEGCVFGTALGAKCHGRREFACNPLFGDTQQECTSDLECQSGELCLGGTCAVVLTACMPACRGDVDCPTGLYCDQSFLGGLCVEEPQTGKGLGAPCTVSDEPDECLGFCQPDSSGATTGHCQTTCALGSECSWDPATEKFEGVCLYQSVLAGDDVAAGDFGFCAATCNCSGECQNSELACYIFDGIGELPAQFRGPGLCDIIDDTVDEYNQCAGVGGEGAGGTGGSVGGAPTGEGGAPGAGTGTGGVGGI